VSAGARFHLGGAPLTTGPQQLTTMAPFFREATVNRETAGSLLDAIPAPLLAWRPAPERWGLADICAHLARTTAVYLPALDATIERAHAAAAYSDAPLRGTLLGRFLVWSMEPPPRFRMRAPAMLRPAPDLPPESARAAYRAAQEALRVRLERAAGVDLTQVRMRLPTFKGLSLPLGTVFAVILAHERRHLWQATALLQSRDFPNG
jgi:hypothetical protein